MGMKLERARGVARALASGVEPRCSSPPTCHAQDGPGLLRTDGAPAAALRLTKVCVEKCGRLAA